MCRNPKDFHAQAPRSASAPKNCYALQSRTAETVVVDKPAEEEDDLGRGHHGHAH
jgi:hypothetical protein